jgi:hypothetical protein
MKRKALPSVALHDPRNPNPWLALYLDQSIPLDAQAKLAFIRNVDSKSRQFLLPVIQPFAKLAIIIFQLFKLLFRKSSAPRFMHWLIYMGLRYFVKPEGNFLILRHFHIGSEVLAFLAANVKGVHMQLHPLRPRTLANLMPNLFVQHDINLYNFIISLNQQLQETGQEIESPEKLDFSMITDGPFDIAPQFRGVTNVLDVQTAIEIYTPLYQLFQSDDDFWRAANSLQLDETIGIYVSKLLNTQHQLALVNNKHPLVPSSILSAGYRLMLHGLASETLHAILRDLKRKQTRSMQVA